MDVQGANTRIKACSEAEQVACRRCAHLGGQAQKAAVGSTPPHCLEGVLRHFDALSDLPSNPLKRSSNLHLEMKASGDRARNRCSTRGPTSGIGNHAVRVPLDAADSLGFSDANLRKGCRKKTFHSKNLNRALPSVRRRSTLPFALRTIP